MILRPAPLRGRYRGRTSLSGLSPLVLVPLCTGLFWVSLMLLLRLLPGSLVSRFVIPVSRLLSLPVKFVSNLLPFCLLELLLLGIPLAALGLLTREELSAALGVPCRRVGSTGEALVCAICGLPEPETPGFNPYEGSWEHR